MSATPRRVGWIIAIAAAVLFPGVCTVVLWRWLPVWKPEWVVEHSPWLGPAMRALCHVQTDRDRARVRCVDRLAANWQTTAGATLGEALKDAALCDEAVKILNYWAQRTDNDDAMERLVEVLNHDPKQDNKVQALSGLGTCSNPKASAALLRATEDPDQDVRVHAINCLSSRQGASAVEAITRSLRDPSNHVRITAVLKAPDFSSYHVFDPLLAALEDREPAVVGYAITSLVAVDEERMAEPLVRLLDHTSDFVAEAAFVTLWSRTNLVNRSMKALVRLRVERVLGWSGVDELTMALQGMIWGAAATPDLCRILADETDPRIMREGPAPPRLRAAKVLEAMMTNLGGGQGDLPEFIQWSDEARLNREQLLAATQKLGVDMIGVLVTACGDRDPQIRRSAFSALCWCDDERVRQAAVAALDRNEPSLVRVAAAITLASLHDDRAYAELISCLNSAKRTLTPDDEAALRSAAIEALGELGDQRAIMPLLECLDGTREEGWHVRWSAVRSLGRMGDQRVILPLIHVLRDKSLVAVTASALGDLGDWRAVPPLLAQLNLAQLGVNNCVTIVEVLGRLGDPRAKAPLIAGLGDGNIEYVRCVVQTLARIGGTEGVDALISLLDHSDYDVVEAVTAQLATMRLTDVQRARMCSPTLP